MCSRVHQWIVNLEGITVVDFTHLLPGPYATQLLADMDAEVIKIEHPDGGDAARTMEFGGVRGSLFDTVNHGKRSVALDLKVETDRAAVHELVADADVVIEQFRPGVTGRLRIDYETLEEENPELIYCSISGYGQTGPDNERVGHDLNFAAATGLVDMTRSSADGRPAIPGFPVADMASGLFATTTILASLLERSLGNAGGRRIDIGMSDVLLSFSQAVGGISLQGGEPRARETVLTGKYPCYDLYETSDGRYLSVAALEPHFWKTLCSEIDRPDLIDGHRSSDPAVRAAVREELANVISSKTLDTWTSRLGPETMAAPVRTVAEALESPQFRARDMVRDGGDEVGRLGFPALTKSSMSTLDRGVPELGEGTQDVLESHGVDPALRADIRSS